MENQKIIAASMATLVLSLLGVYKIIRKNKSENEVEYETDEDD